jgi:hypothetical protein
MNRSGGDGGSAKGNMLLAGYAAAMIETPPNKV